MESRDGTTEPGLVDAGDFLGFTTRLREAHGRVEGARVSREKKGRWQRRLIAIADAGHRDLEQASELLRRFEAELDKQA
jgi:hypothetical protein